MRPENPPDEVITFQPPEAAILPVRGSESIAPINRWKRLIGGLAAAGAILAGPFATAEAEPGSGLPPGVEVSGDLEPMPDATYEIYRFHKKEPIDPDKPEKMYVGLDVQASQADGIVWLVEYEPEISQAKKEDEGFDSTYGSTESILPGSETSAYNLYSVTGEALLIAVNTRLTILDYSPGWIMSEGPGLAAVAFRDKDTIEGAETVHNTVNNSVETFTGASIKVSRPGDSIIWTSLPCNNGFIPSDVPQGTGGADLLGGDLHNATEPWRQNCGYWSLDEGTAYRPTTWRWLPRNKYGVTGGVSSSHIRAVVVSIPPKKAKPENTPKLILPSHPTPEPTLSPDSSPSPSPEAPQPTPSPNTSPPRSDDQTPAPSRVQIIDRARPLQSSPEGTILRFLIAPLGLAIAALAIRRRSRSSV